MESEYMATNYRQDIQNNIDVFCELLQRSNRKFIGKLGDSPVNISFIYFLADYMIIISGWQLKLP
jgi:hypothetical protein